MVTDKLKLKWDYFEFNPIYYSNDKVKNQYDNIFNIAKDEILKFERDNNVEIVTFFNHTLGELSLYSFFPNTYEVKMKSHYFLDKLNDYLKNNFEFPEK